MTALDAVDVTQRSDTDRTYFDLGGRAAASYGPVAGTVVGVAALLLGVIAWLRVMRTAIRLEGVLRWLLTAFWTLAGSAAVIASMVGATWALRLAREVYHPWYARPGRLFLLLLAVGITVAWSSARLGQWLPARAHGVRHPIIAWSMALPLWIALGASATFLAPGAAYLWLLPLLSAGLLLSCHSAGERRRRAGGLRPRPAWSPLRCGSCRPNPSSTSSSPSSAGCRS